MELVLVSSCLLGEPVRYDGSGKRSDAVVLRRWTSEGRVVMMCPEIAGGLPVPRPPAEITFGVGGADVIARKASVIEAGGADVSTQFVSGAKKVLALVKSKRIKLAVLKEGSPSCGSSYIYDGTFSGVKVPQAGVTAALLQQAGIQVFSEKQLTEADAFLKELAKRGSGFLKHSNYS